MRISAAASQELGVTALFDDPTAIDHDDAVGEAHGRQAVGDDEGGAPGGRALERFHHDALGVGVETGGRLVEDENGGVPQHGARDGKALLLPARERGPSLRHLSVIALGEPPDELIRHGDVGRGDDLLLAGSRTAKGDVLPQGPAEDEGVLQDQADLLAQRLQGVVPNVLAINQDRAPGGVVEARDQANQGALTGARGPDDGNLLSRRDRQVNMREHGLAGLVLEGYVAELDLTLEARGGARPLPIRQFTPHAHHVGDALGRHAGPVEHVGEARQGLHGVVEAGDVGEEDDHVSGRQLS